MRFPCLLMLALLAAAPSSGDASASPSGTVAPSLAPSETIPPERFAAATQQLYARRDVAALQRLCGGATGEADLLCRYRLFPLTQDESLIANLPVAAPTPTARGNALLSGLWGYRAARAPLLRVPAYGGRSLDLLRRARALDARDPFVLLVDGQSLLFRPAIAGGDRRAALARFRALQGIVGAAPGEGVAPMEADLWVWFALFRAGDRTAADLHARLLARNPPPLYRDFLLHPPRA